MKPLSTLLDGGYHGIVDSWRFPSAESEIGGLVDDMYRALRASQRKQFVRFVDLEEEEREEVLAPEAESIETTFAELADSWERDTAVESFVIRKVVHPSYQQIIGMGRPAVPLILRRLESSLGHWFWALSAITREDPAADTDSMEDAARIWLQWGRDRGLV